MMMGGAMMNEGCGNGGWQDHNDEQWQGRTTMNKEANSNGKMGQWEEQWWGQEGGEWGMMMMGWQRMRWHAPQPYKPLLIGWVVGGMMMQQFHNCHKQLLTGWMWMWESGTYRMRDLDQMQMMKQRLKRSQHNVSCALGNFVLFWFPFFVTNKNFRYLLLLTVVTMGGHHHHHMRGKRDWGKGGTPSVLRFSSVQFFIVF
jgi:hypothetical protein